MTIEGPDTEVSPAVLRRVFLLGMLPMLGVLLFAVAGALALRAFGHNNSLACDNVFGAATSCSHTSYALPITVGVVALLLVMGGGALASYYAARHVGLPLLAVLRQRRTGSK
jgi:hypothetical protein